MQNVKSDSLIEGLATFLPPERLLHDPSELLVYEADGFTIAKATPRAVVFPNCTEEVVRIVKCLAEHAVPIVPRGSGTGLTGGCVAFGGGVIVSTVKMNRILEIDLENRVAHVEAGVRNTQLSDAVLRECANWGGRLSGRPGADTQSSASAIPAFHFSPDPSSQRASTIGGNAATNAGGIHVLKDFVTSNHVLGMELVLSSGEVVEIGASDGSYESDLDLCGLVCGSEGTLGIITKLWVRLIPKPASFRTILSVFGSTADACNAVSRVIADGHLPAAMEMMDGQMVELVNRTFNLGIDPSARALLLTEIDGIDKLLDIELEEIESIMREHRAITIQSSADPATREKLWTARKKTFGAIGKISPSYCTQDACIPRSKLAEALERFTEIGREFGLQINNVFHAGDGNVHPIFLYDDRDPSQVKNVLAAAEVLLRYCIDIDGTLSGEHGVGVEKLHLMPYQFDAATTTAFETAKRAFDPAGQINSGKLIPDSELDVSIQHPGRHVPQ